MLLLPIYWVDFEVAWGWHVICQAGLAFGSTAKGQAFCFTHLLCCRHGGCVGDFHSVLLGGPLLAVFLLMLCTESLLGCNTPTVLPRLGMRVLVTQMYIRRRCMCVYIDVRDPGVPVSSSSK